MSGAATKFPSSPGYRGRLAPSPTGLLHLGHARTFWTAFERSRNAGGTLVLRNEDLDPQRSKAEFVLDYIEDLRWLGIDWQEGPDSGGPCGPYNQSQRLPMYLQALEQLKQSGAVYPCTCSRKEVQALARAPHAEDEEPVYAGTCRPVGGRATPPGARANWRFRVNDGEAVEFIDSHFGPQRFIAGQDFGDFVVWRHDGVPSYQLAVVVDDAAMRITEVVRGADLLLSTARQILLYRALGLEAPLFYHCPLMTDAQGQRLAKRSDALSLRHFRQQGMTPQQVRELWKS